MNKIASNTVEGRALALAERIENLLIQIETEQELCREQCAPIREDIAEVWKEAKAGELPIEAMRAYLRVRTAQRKAVARLEPGERDAYDRLRESLGPLGAAAAERAGYTVTLTSGMETVSENAERLTKLVDRAFAEGKAVSADGGPAKPEYAPETPLYRAFMDGYAQHQATLAAQLGNGKPAEA